MTTAPSNTHRAALNLSAQAHRIAQEGSFIAGALNALFFSQPQQLVSARAHGAENAISAMGFGADHQLQETRARVKSQRLEGSSSQIARGWANEILGPGDLTDAVAAFLGAAACKPGATRQVPSIASEDAQSSLALAEALNAHPELSSRLCPIAAGALGGTSGSDWLSLIWRYKGDNGYRGTHALLSVREISALALSARAISDGKGRSIRIFATISGARIALFSIKRKGGSMASDSACDQLAIHAHGRGLKLLATKGAFQSAAVAQLSARGMRPIQ